MKQTFEEKNIIRILIVATIILSIFSFIYYYADNQIHLAFGDAVSRLDISRKIIDNLNPGLGQIGSVWLPLPFLLMLPFIGNDFLWHSGIAGYIVSGISYVLTIFFLYKLAKIAFNKESGAIFTAIFGLTSVNFIYSQTTALSEPLYIMTITGATYFLYKWAKFGTIPGLMVAAFFVSAATFTRYEGYFVFILALLLIAIISFLKHQKREKTEGSLFLFITLAGTGIVMWCLYNWIIFGNPLFWKDIYLGNASIISGEVLVKQYTAPQFLVSPLSKIIHAIETCWTAILETNGIVISVLAFIASLIFTFKLFFKELFKKPENLVLFLPLGTLLFLFVALYGGFPLETPPITLSNLLNRQTNLIGEYNLIYGLTLLPFVALMLGYLFSRNKIGAILVLIFFIIQMVTTFFGPYFTIYQFSSNFEGSPEEIINGHNKASEWLKQHYDKGKIMISALNHNPDMFYLRLDLKTFIHEGAGKYWVESKTNPQKYASWIYMYTPKQSKDDTVTKYMIDNPNLDIYFDQVYNDGTYLIYKIKTKPEIEL